MNAVTRPAKMRTTRDADGIAASKAVRWDIDADVVRGRQFNHFRKYLPDTLSLVPEFTTLTDTERAFVSQIQGRTYVNVFGLAERFFTAKQLDAAREQAIGDQIALEGRIRSKDGELKHQAHFWRIEQMMAETMRQSPCNAAVVLMTCLLRRR